jgi:hypothetical protein
VQEAAAAGLAGRVQEDPSPLDIRPDEIVRLQDGPVHVGLGGEVDDGLDPVSLQDLRHHLLVANVAAHEDVAGVAREVRQVARVSGVGQLVEIHDSDGRVGGEEVADEIRADESHPARHQDRPAEIAHRSPPPRPCRFSSIRGSA